MATDAGQAAALEPAEWWQRAGARLRDWRDRHPVASTRLLRVRVLALWLSVALVIVTFVAIPEVRDGLRVWVWVYALLVAWFLLGRTKSVPWALVATLFAVSVPWAGVIGWISTLLSASVGGTSGVAAGTVIAGFTEESLKLVPVAALAVAAPGFVRRLGVVDWLLIGFACGLGFTLFEELVRRTAISARRPSVWDLILGEACATCPQYGPNLLGGGFEGPWATYAGHHVATGLVTAAVGLGIAAWRRGVRLTATGRPAAVWPALALVLPLATWWLLVVDHVGFNAANSSGREWVESDQATLPWLIRVSWDLSGEGHGRAVLLVIVLALGLLIDVRRTARSTVELPPALAAVWSPPSWLQPPESWTMSRRSGDYPSRPPAVQVVLRWVVAAARAAVGLAVHTARDLRVLVVAHRRDAGEPMRAAMRRGRAAMSMLRLARADLFAPDAGRTRSSRRRTRALALACGGLLLAAGLVLAPVVADGVGASLTQQLPVPRVPSWLAGALDALAEWWGGLGLPGQLLVGAALVGVIMLSGGSLGVAMWAAGGAMYVADKGHGAADFVRDPATATRRYFETTTPAGLVVDALDAALTLIPPARGAAAGRRAMRDSVDDYVGSVPRMVDDVPPARPVGREAYDDTATHEVRITPNPVWRTDHAPLYRADNRPPDAIFDGGFQPRNPEMTDLDTFVRTNEPSAFVSTSRDPNLIHEWGSAYRYEVDAPGGIDVSQTLPRDHFPNEAEVAFPGGVDPAHIRGAHPYDPATGQLGEWIPNPNYVPREP